MRCDSFIDELVYFCQHLLSIVLFDRACKADIPYRHFSCNTRIVYTADLIAQDTINGRELRSLDLTYTSIGHKRVCE